MHLLQNRLDIKLTEHAVGWFYNYMTDRTWCIVSNWLSGVNRVPQGSVLSPLLFSVSVNNFRVATKGTQTYCKKKNIFYGCATELKG